MNFKSLMVRKSVADIVAGPQLAHRRAPRVLVAWIFGWDPILEYAMGVATVAVGWSGYVARVARGLDGHPIRR